MMKTYQPKFQFDHIAIVAMTLEQGVSYVQNTLGIEIPYGGSHPRMGTHNHLLSLGSNEFLEVIAIDPNAKCPNRPRWFNLDKLHNIKPRIGAWIVNTSDIKSSLQFTSAGCGSLEEMTRDSLKWQISIPSDGSLPFGGAFPTIIQWPMGSHPASNMKDLGCELMRLKIEHPEADTINQKLADSFEDQRVSICIGSEFTMKAEINTPNGIKTL